MPNKIILAGEGGQGVQTIAKIITQAAQKSQKYSCYLPSFGVEQRGGASVAFVQISSGAIVYPRFAKANVAVAFGSRAIAAIKDYLTDNTLLIYDNSAVSDKNLRQIKDHVKDYLAIPAQSLARSKLSSKVSNVILLGGIATHLKEINYQDFENSILEKFASKIVKNPELKELNIKALKLGLEEAEQFDKTKSPFAGAEDKEIQTTFAKENISWERFPEYCKGCGLCLAKCPVKALQFSQDRCFLGNPLPIVDLRKCTGCGECQRLCPDGAIRVEKR